MTEIPNTELKNHLLPKPQADWLEVSGFAHSFNGYEYWGSFEKCGDLANKILENYKTSGQLSTNLTSLRTCLFFEARRWRHYGYDPDEEALRYARALVEARQLVFSQEDLNDINGGVIARRP